MLWLDRVLSILLILGGVGHTVGSFVAYGQNPMMLFWAVNASLFVFLLAAVNLLRTWRPGDRALACICLAGCLCWIAGAMRFGYLVGNMLDIHAVIFALISLGLCMFCVRSLRLVRN